MRAGFTLIESVIVLAILGVILAIAIPAYQRYIEQTRVLDTIAAMRSIQTKVSDHYRATGAMPANLAAVGYGSSVDAWGRPYVYTIITSPAVARKDKRLAPLNSDYDLFSTGRDGSWNNSLADATSRDDIVRARDGRFVGLAEEFDP